MPSLSDFGLAPEEPEEQRPRRHRYVVRDESGARPLPRDDYDAYEVYDAEPLDEEVELPGVSRAPASLFFGIGVGLGLAVIAVVAGLYLGGYVGRPALGLGPEPAALEPDSSRFETFWNDQAFERARFAEARFTAPPAAAPTQVNSPDIQVIDEAPGTKAERAPIVAPPARTGSGDLSNELDELKRSVPPRGPDVPKPGIDQASPPLPPPAQPTAPAETSAPDTIPPPEPNP